MNDETSAVMNGLIRRGAGGALPAPPPEPPPGVSAQAAEAGRRAGLPEPWWGRLRGVAPDELEADAAALADALDRLEPTPPVPDLDAGVKAQSTPGSGPSMNSLIRGAIIAARQAPHDIAVSLDSLDRR